MSQTRIRSECGNKLSSRASLYPFDLELTGSTINVATYKLSSCPLAPTDEGHLNPLATPAPLLGEAGEKMASHKWLKPLPTGIEGLLTPSAQRAPLQPMLGDGFVLMRGSEAETPLHNLP